MGEVTAWVSKTPNTAGVCGNESEPVGDDTEPLQPMATSQEAKFGKFAAKSLGTEGNLK